MKETRSTSYDILNAHVAIVFTQYILLSKSQRSEEDDKTIDHSLGILNQTILDIDSETNSIVPPSIVSVINDILYHVTNLKSTNRIKNHNIALE